MGHPRYFRNGILVGERLFGADEGAHEFAVDLRGDGIGVDSLGGEKLAGIFDAIDSSRFDGNLLKVRRVEQRVVLRFFQRACHAAYPQFDIAADFRGDFALYHHIGDCESATRTQDAEGFAEDFSLVRGKIDHAIGNHDIHGIIG